MFPFKKKFNYKISANVKTTIEGGAYYTTIWHKLSNFKGFSQGCNPPETVEYDWHSQNGYGYNQLTNSSKFEEKVLYSGNVHENFQYLLMSASPTSYHNSLINGFIYGTYIQKITVTENSGLNISPLNTTVVCDDTQPVTYTINNPNNIDYIQNYRWVISNAKGWLYNGDTATNEIITTNNSLTLTPTCMAKSFTIKAIVSFNGTNYKDTTKQASFVRTIPPLFISGPEKIYAHDSATYTTNVSSIGCNNTITWSLSPLVGAFFADGNSARVHASGPDVGSGGRGELKAIVNVCDSTIVLTKAIDVGYANPNDYTFLNSGPSCFDYAMGFQYFGIGYKIANTNPPLYKTGCDLGYQRDIRDVEWMIFCDKPYTVNYNQGGYSCNLPSVANNVGFKVTFKEYPAQPYVMTFLYRVKNFMGWSDWSVGNYYMVRNCSGGGGWGGIDGIALQRNLSDFQNRQTINDKDATLITEIQIVDRNLKVIQSWNYDEIVSGKVKFNIDAYIKAEYSVRIFDGKKWIYNYGSKQVQD